MAGKVIAAPQRRQAGDIEYIFTRKEVRRINLRVNRDGSVAVSAPRRTPLFQVDAFVESQREWVLRAQAKMKARSEAQGQAAPLSPAEAKAHLQALSDRVYPDFEAVLGRPPVIRVRDMSSRWGVCHTSRKQITFALELVRMPLPAQEYVVLHEYCHFLVSGHGPAFWAEVEKRMPDWKARRALLR